ncbi:class I SAM-dependent methyltransferase [Patescibacteria group bacterium]|nr:class I SAM-dependent methyltransferase [Patescibacteria group bacterium]
MTTKSKKNKLDKMSADTSSCAICNCKGNYKILLHSTLRDDYSDINMENFSARRLPDRVHGTIVRCVKCNLVRTLEVVNPIFLSLLYRRSDFTYKDILENLTRTYMSVIFKAVKYLEKKKSFLEIGCGNGFLFKDVVSLGFKNVVGVEPSINAISFAEEHIRPLIKNTVLKDNIFPPASFDMLAGFQVFDHIQNPNKFLSVCYDILKTGGILVLMNHNVNSFSAKILKGKSPIYDIEHPYLYGVDTMRSILIKNGFDVVNSYNPGSYFSLRYIARLFPLPKKLKMDIINSRCKFLDITVKTHPGNLCLIARKVNKKST